MPSAQRAQVAHELRVLHLWVAAAVVTTDTHRTMRAGNAPVPNSPLVVELRVDWLAAAIEVLGSHGHHMDALIMETGAAEGVGPTRCCQEYCVRSVATHLASRQPIRSELPRLRAR